MQNIKTEWELNQEFADIPSGCQPTRRMHWSHHWIFDIRTIALDLNTKGLPVSMKKITVEMNRKLKDYSFTLRRTTCICLLRTMGFGYNHTSNAINYEETKQIKDWREKYLKHRSDIWEKQPEAIELWLDESYCNQFYTGGKSWFHPGDFVHREKHGCRWVIVHCGGADGWIGTPLVFEANSSVADYHKNMNADVFEEYFSDLCSKIVHHYPEECLRKGIYIYMDNAAYHKHVMGLEAGISRLQKKELIEWMKKCSPTLNDKTFIGKMKKEIYGLPPTVRAFTGTPAAFSPITTGGADSPHRV